jgi:hypothetical protein
LPPRPCGTICAYVPLLCLTPAAACGVYWYLCSHHEPPPGGAGQQGGGDEAVVQRGQWQQEEGGKKNKSAGGATVRGLRLPLMLKFPKEGTLRMLEQLDRVLKETFVLLNREMDLYRYSPGLPEFIFSILQQFIEGECSFALTLCEYFPNLAKIILLHVAHLQQKKSQVQQGNWQWSMVCLLHKHH